jgi:NAD(P)-dependent dehydrogenase (short-subunit alcohol dehydrogenase family)
MHPWLLVSSASSGIGLGIVRRLLATTNAPIVATTRGDINATRTSILEGLNSVQGHSIDDKQLEVLNVDVTGI